MDRATFDLMRDHWGRYGSWAVWAEGDISNLTVLDPDRHPELLDALRDDIVLVGFNCSGPFSQTFRNFHAVYPGGKDRNLRYALRGTRCWGAWMTDIVKGVPSPDSNAVKRFLREHPEEVRTNVDKFVQELTDLGGSHVIVGFGRDVQDFIRRNVPPHAYDRLVPIAHWAARAYNSDVDYRRHVLDRLAEYGLGES